MSREAAGRPVFGTPKGFTLVEVLVAAAIAGLVFGLAFQIFAEAASRQTGAQREETAAIIAEDTLTRVGIDIPLMVGTTHGQTEGGYMWQIDISDAGSERPAIFGHNSLKRVQVTVLWRDTWGGHRAQLVTLRVAPGV